MRNRTRTILHIFLVFSAQFLSSTARYVLLFTQDDLNDALIPSSEDDDLFSSSGDWDGFCEYDAKTDEDLDPGSWRSIFEDDAAERDGDHSGTSGDETLYYSGVSKISSAISSGDLRLMDEAGSEIEAAAAGGYPHAQSTLGLLYDIGMVRERNRAKAFTHHYFAAEGGNMQSKMVLAYTYFRQEMLEKSVKLYAELAEVAINSFFIFMNLSVNEMVRIHTGAEKNNDNLRKFRGEDDEDFQILEYQAEKGNAEAMYIVGIFYYFGRRGIRRNHAKALSWFFKAVEKGEPRAMEHLGELYMRGAGVERNYTKALKWLTQASRQNLYSSYNGLGYLYVKGYGVEKNYMKAKQNFEWAAENKDSGGFYNLGVLYLKGIGVKRDVNLARAYFLNASNAGQPKAIYQLAKMFQTGVGLKKNLQLATSLYKLVAEHGPWSSLSWWALEAYLKGDLGKALFLYLRMSELGYEKAQSNAAWILDKHGEHSMCMGKTGFCTDGERHQLVHTLWWKASEQGNQHAALLIGDAYYYGRGVERDHVLAAEAYLHAKSMGNAQAMFNLGFMHEHGQGLPLDLHLAKRYYDLALETDTDSKLPVTLALTSLWIRKNYPDSFLVEVIDSLPEFFPKLEAWVEDVLMEEGNATILALIVCLLTVLYFRERRRRNAAPPVFPRHQPENGVQLQH